MLFLNKLRRKGLTLAEIIVAVGVLGIAIVPLVGMIQSYMSRSYYHGGTRDYVDRAKNIMENLVENTSFVEINRFNEVLNADLDDRTTTIVEDLSEIRTNIPLGAGAPVSIDPDNYNPSNYRPIINVADGEYTSGDTPVDLYIVEDGETYFRYKGIEYYFKLEITNIPLEMNFRCFLSSPPEGDVLTERVFTRDLDGNIRDMFKKFVLYVNWEMGGNELEYSLVSFKANIETAFDNQ